MKKVIVSLTTTNHRKEMCAHTVLSLIRQKTLPSKIIVWVSSDPYLMDTGIITAPEWVDELNKIKNIIEVRWTKNIGPYRKLLPIIADLDDNDIVITVDDDVIYGEKWLQFLIKSAIENPEMVVAARVRSISFNCFGVQQSYMNWPIAREDVILEKNYAVIGCGGVVYRKKLFKPEFLQDDSYLSVCPTTDDLWFSGALIKEGVRAYVCTAALGELKMIVHDGGLVSHNLTKEPKKKISKVLHKIKTEILGYLGAKTCGNDYAYARIKSFLEKK